MMKEIKLIEETPTTQAVRRLAFEHPDWLSVLEAAAAVAARVEDHGGEFAGAWVVSELAERGAPRWIPNLRLLASYGLIEKSGPSTKGGRRAYYRMPDRAGVVEAIEAWRSNHGAASRKTLQFVGAGESTEPPHDTGRHSGEVRYEPRSWR